MVEVTFLQGFSRERPCKEDREGLCCGWAHITRGGEERARLAGLGRETG